MKKILCSTLLVLLSAVSYAAEPIVASVQLVPIKEALTRYLCYQIYWQGQNYRSGVSVPLEIKIRQDKFLAWGDSLQLTKRDRISNFFIGRMKEGRGAVILMRGYNLNLSPQVPGYAEDRDHFRVDTIKDALTVPTDCTPRYDPSTLQKERMVDTIVSTLQNQLSSLVRSGAAKYPKEVKLIIADFNVDYPETYVLVEPANNFAGDLYTVTLHDPKDYDSGEYERDGEYPLGQKTVKPYLKPLLKKIRKHGIAKKITITPYG